MPPDTHKNTPLFLVESTPSGGAPCIHRSCSFFATDGQIDNSVLDVEVPTNPVPLQRKRPASFAPLLPREPPPRQALLPKPANRQERHLDSNAGRIEDARQRPDSSSPSSAANGESGVYVSRVPSFQSRRQPPKGTQANREGIMDSVFSVGEHLLRKLCFLAVKNQISREHTPGADDDVESRVVHQTFWRHGSGHGRVGS